MGTRHLSRGDDGDVSTAGILRSPLTPEEVEAAGPPEPPGRSLSEGIGWAILGALLFAILVGCLAFDRSGRPSLVGDEATYAMQAASLAWDFDLAYTRGDYDRFVAQWGGPPDGVILQSSDGGAHITYGKPFLYALAIAPFVRLSPLRGALVANLLMLAAGAVLAARTLRQRGGPLAPLAVAVLLFGSVAFAYVFWEHADVFLLAATVAGYAVAYGGDHSRPQHGSVAPQVFAAAEGERSPWRQLTRWLAAGMLLAIPIAFRPFYVVLLLPALAAIPAGRRRQGWSVMAGGAVAVLLLTAVVQHAAGGGWSGYSGQRLGFYPRTGYPAVDFPPAQWDEQLRRWGNASWVQEGAFEPSHSVKLWAWDTLYFFIGRNVGVLPYFLPLLLAAAAFGRGRGRWLIPLAVAAAAAGFFLVRPFNFYGGGGAIGNRYFLPLYGALWFMVGRPLRLAHLALTVALAAPFMLPLWRQPSAYPIGEDGRYRHVSESARRLLPYETTQSSIPGGQDLNQGGLWIKLLNHDVYRPNGSERLEMVASGSAELLIGSPKPLKYLAVDLDRHAPSRLEAGGLQLRPSILRASGWEEFEIELRKTRAVHPMWWTPDDVYLYEVTLRLPGGRAAPVGLALHRGEDPARLGLGLDDDEGGASGDGPGPP